MKRLLVLLAAVGLIGLLAVRVVVAFNERAAYEAPREAVPAVRTARVVRADFPRLVPVTGTLRPRVEVDVFTKRGGRLLDVRFDVGDRVKEGDLLAVVEHEEVLWQARQAEAAVAVASAGVDGARLEFTRTESLLQAGSVPQAVLDGAKVKLDLAQAQLSQAQAAAGLARAVVDHARVRAPISGVVTRRMADPGAMAGTQFPLFTLQDADVLELRTSVEAASFPLLERGQNARVTLDEVPGRSWSATVTRLSPALDSTTRRASVVLTLQPPDDGERAGLLTNAFARADILVGTRTAALAVPREAIVDGTDGSRTLFRIDSDVARALTPQLGEVHDGLVAVVSDDSGLKESDVVVIHGHSRLVDGAVIRVATESADATEGAPAAVQTR